MNLTSIINQYCEVRQREEGLERDNSKFRMSDAGKCRLMRYWKRQGKPYDPADMPPNVLRSLQVGILLHEWVESILHSGVGMNFISVQTEGTLEDEHRLGHYDVLITMTNVTQWLFDVKTINGKKAYYMREKGEGPSKQHIYQIVTYAERLDPRPERLTLAYIDRDTLDIFEHPIDFDGFWPVVKSDWDTLIEAWNTQTEPAPNPEHWECNYCMYKKDCPHV